jgi:hypothetical protein
MSGFVRGIFPRARANKYLFSKHHAKLPKRDEPRKVVVSGSLATAVRRCLIHLLPILTSVAILVVNIHGIYIGIDFSGPLKSDTIHLMFLQLAAKAHEIMIVASLSLIVLQTVRHEMLFGDGLPLGLVGSGIMFSHFEFFFKREFYGALKYLASHGNKARKFGFVALLVVSGLTAVLAGPASAVLLVPKSQTYPSGGTDFFLNGSEHHFWPDDLASDISELQHYCCSENSTSLGVCPGGGFLSLWKRWNAMNYTNFIRTNVPSYAKDLAGSHFYWPIDSPASQIPPLYTLGNPRPDNQTLQPHTWLVQAHAASAVMLQHITADWWKVLPSQMGVDPLRIDDRNIKASVSSIISSVRCADPQNISASDKIVQFPTIEGRWSWAKNADLAVDTLNTTAVDHLRFHWIHLPDGFGASSIGGVFETPWVSENRTRLVIGCSAQTGWVPTDLLTDSYTFWSGWYPYGIDFGARTPSWTAVGEGEPLSPTNGRIALGDEWLNLLTPPAPTIGSQSSWWQASTIERILTSAGLADLTSSWNGTTLKEDWLNGDILPDGGKTRLLEAVICSILADGLSRSGSHRVFNTTGPSAEWSLAMYNPRQDFDKQILQGRTAFTAPNVPSVNITTLHASMQITGFAYRVTLASYISMVVLLTHMAMALAHIIWVVCHRRTSRSWNSIAELISLSQNSQPAFDSLRNTGAGIHRSETFARVAKIRVRPQPGSPDLDHIELVFGDFTGPAGEVDSEGSAASTGAESTSTFCGLGTGTVHKGRGSWTFPLGLDERHLQTDVELESRSSARERLIPKVHLADVEKGDTVCVNYAYS